MKYTILLWYIFCERDVQCLGGGVGLVKMWVGYLGRM